MSARINRSAQKKRQSKKSKNTIGIWIIGISAAVVILVVLAVALNSRPSVSAIAAPDVPAEWVNRTTLGNPDAPVTVQAWEDFLCPACGQWTAQIKPLLMEDYIKEGTVKFEFHHFPLQIHAPGAEMGAMASECAADQGAFWPYHDRLFQAQTNGQSGFTIDALVRYADELDLDSQQMLQCMSALEHQADVTESVNQAISMGLNATPSILINGVRVEDPYNYNAIQSQLDSLIAAAGS